MNKTLTIKVPDELWVNKFEKNLTKTFEYDGPASFWVKIRMDAIQPEAFEQEPVLIDLTEQKHFINIENATDAELALAIMIIHGAEPYEFTYSDEVNHDGSIYKKIENPRVEDYYMAKFFAEKVQLELITKDTTIQNEIIALERRNYVTKYSDAFDFEPQQQALIDDFLQRINTYLEAVKTAYPWKFVELSKNEIPKIPLSLVTIFNSLPELK